MKGRTKISLSQVKARQPSRIPTVRKFIYSDDIKSTDAVEYIGVAVARCEDISEKDALRVFLGQTRYSSKAKKYRGKASDKNENQYSDKNNPIYVRNDEEKLIKKLINHTIKNQMDYSAGVDIHIIAAPKGKIRDGIIVCQDKIRSVILETANKHNDEDASLKITNSFV